MRVAHSSTLCVAHSGVYGTVDIRGCLSLSFREPPHNVASKRWLLDGIA